MNTLHSDQTTYIAYHKNDFLIFIFFHFVMTIIRFSRTLVIKYCKQYLAFRSEYQLHHIHFTYLAPYSTEGKIQRYVSRRSNCKFHQRESAFVA